MDVKGEKVNLEYSKDMEKNWAGFEFRPRKKSETSNGSIQACTVQKLELRGTQIELG